MAYCYLCATENCDHIMNKLFKNKTSTNSFIQSQVGLYSSDSYVTNYKYKKRFFANEPFMPIPSSIAAPMNVTKALDRLQKTCENTGSDCQELVALRTAGWEIRIDQAVSYDDRKGFQITLLEPKEK